MKKIFKMTSGYLGENGGGNVCIKGILEIFFGKLLKTIDKTTIIC